MYKRSYFFCIVGILLMVGCGKTLEGSKTTNSKELPVDASQAVSIAMDDLKKELVKFPKEFQLIVKDIGHNIEISFIPGMLITEGGDLEIIIDKKSGTIIKRIAGQ